jgi:ABC-2 type transport system ATP-binding protein
MSGTVPSGASTAFLEVRKLTRRFGAFTAVDAVDFDVPRGKVFGFLGPNGSGKSTTIRMLAGLLEPTSGSVTGFGGLDVTRDTDLWKSRLGYMSQKFSLYLDLSVAENLRFFGTLYGLALTRIEERVSELSQRLGFGTLLSAMTAGLSTGQRQRVALAAALLHEPELLFLDEPTGGVDPKGRRLFWDLIYELAADRGMTVLVTTHYMDEAEQCDRLAFILNGRIIADGPPHGLKDGLRGRIFEVDPGAAADPFEELSRVKGEPALEDAYLFGRRLRVVARPGEEPEARRLVAPLGTPAAAEPSLEDVFVSLARQQPAAAERLAV